MDDLAGLENYSYDYIKNILVNFIGDFHLDIVIKSLYITGSRAKEPKECYSHYNSDLDVVIEYYGEIKEDTVHNLLNDSDSSLHIEGIKVDFIPIQLDKGRKFEDFIYNKKSIKLC